MPPPPSLSPPTLFFLFGHSLYKRISCTEWEDDAAVSYVVYATAPLFPLQYPRKEEISPSGDHYPNWTCRKEGERSYFAPFDQSLTARVHLCGLGLPLLFLAPLAAAVISIPAKGLGRLRFLGIDNVDSFFAIFCQNDRNIVKNNLLLLYLIIN